MTQYHFMLTQANITVNYWSCLDYASFNNAVYAILQPEFHVSNYQIYSLGLGLAQSVNDNWFATSSRSNYHCSVPS